MNLSILNYVNYIYVVLELVDVMCNFSDFQE